ncbi:hypothetical protein AB6813_13590 [bacterium RCC_150]
MALALPILAGCSISSQQTKERQYIANSFAELIDQALAGPFLQEFDREILQRAKATGRIDQGDYDEAYGRFERCMSASGEPVSLKKFRNGLYRVDTTPLSPGESLDSAMDVVTECSKGTIFHIANLYGIQQGNPKLLADPSQIVFECMEAKGLVTGDFSLKEFAEAVGTPGQPGVPLEKRLPFDPYADEAQACFLGGNMTITKASS